MVTLYLLKVSPFSLSDISFTIPMVVGPLREEIVYSIGSAGIVSDRAASVVSEESELSVVSIVSEGAVSCVSDVPAEEPQAVRRTRAAQRAASLAFFI